MKNTLMSLLGTIILFCTACSGPPPSGTENEIILSSIHIKPNPGNDTLQHIEVSKTIIRDEGEHTLSTLCLYDVEVSFAPLDKSSWKGTWTITNVNTQYLKDPMEKKMEEINKGFVFEGLFDSNGVFVDLLNWETVQKKVQTIIDTLKRSIYAEFGSTPDIEKELEVYIQNTFSSKEKIKEYFLKEMEGYFSLNGLAWENKDTLKREEVAVDPLNGYPLRQITRIPFPKVYADSSCLIHIFTKTNRTDLVNSLIQSLTQMQEEEREQMEEYANSIEMSRFTFKEYKLSLKTGWVEYLRIEKKIKSDFITTTFITEIKVKKPDKL